MPKVYVCVSMRLCNCACLQMSVGVCVCGLGCVRACGGMLVV